MGDARDAREAWENYEWARLAADLRADAGFMFRCQFTIQAYKAVTDDWNADPLNEHAGELCQCGMPVGDHDCVDGHVLGCQDTGCEGFYPGVW